jgi:hypothetical protein
VVATLPTAGFAAGDRVDAGARAAGADESWLRDMHARIDRPRHDASAPPATVPLLTSPSWTAESDQAQALFGYSVLTAGDVNGDGFSDVIVGSPGYGSGAGRAWVFLGSSTGLSPTALWTADGDQAGAGFGTSVGTAGDVNGDGYADVVIGAPGYSFDQTGEGRAFVYLGSSGGLSLSPAWMADGEQELAAFGCSVGTAGDVNGDGYADIIVGAGRFDSGEVDTGRAYVYGGSADGLSAGPVWTGEGDQIGSLFGSSVGTAGDVNADGYADIIVGSPGHDYTQADEGRACVYRGSPGGLSTYAYWTADGNQQGARFGGSVATAGDVNGDGFSDVLVGADGYDNGEADEGRAFLYEGSFSGLATSPAWTAEGNQVSAGFGVSVATAGDVNGDGYADVIVGASSYDNGQTDEGRAFVYLGSRSGLAASAIATVESNQASAHFGSSVGTAGDVNGDGLSDFIVGAKNFDGGQINGGRAYVYHGVAGVLAATPSWTAIGDQAYATFGTSVATAGDVNGDGYSDVIVGAPMYDNEYYTEGRAYVYLGSSGGLSTEPSWIVEGDEPGAYLGTCVATAGDVNGDGFSDVIVSAYRASHGQDQEGLVYAYLGSPSGLSTTPAWMGESDQAGAWYGFSAATAGDVNGDGYSDVIVGAAIYDTTQPDAGRVYVYFGSANGLSATADWTKDCQQAYAKFGVFVGTAGDVNGDGYSDIIVGAYQYDNGSTDEGRAFVYLGSADGVSADPVWTAESNQADAWFGYPVRTAGDVNGDGYSDIIVGAQWYTNDHLREGRAYAYYGSPTGLSANPSWMAEGNQALAAFGVSVATAGDVNNDGYSDVIIGAQHYDNPESDEGRAYVYLGSPTGLAASPAWTTESNQADALLGYSANTAGDVNGDGFSDVIVGTYYYDNGSQTDVGRADVYCGNAGGGLHRLPGQTRADGSTPIWPMGMSDALGEFSLRAVGRTPLGRGAVRLQYEMKPFGTPFDGSGLVTGSALDSGSPRRDGSLVRLLQPVTGLALNTLFHWRLRTVSNSPLFPQSPWFTLPYNSVTEADIRTIRVISDAPEGPDPGSGLLMVRSSPNPFGASTSLDYAVPERGRVMLGIYDAAGREVVILVDRDEEPGLRTVQWDGVDSRGVRAPAGVYFGRLRAGGRERASKIVLSR